MGSEHFGLQQFFECHDWVRLADFWGEFVPYVGAAITKDTLTNQFLTDGGSKFCCGVQFTESAVAMINGGKIVEVDRCWGVKALPNKEHYFELDSVRNRKPMELLKDGGDVLEFASSSD